MEQPDQHTDEEEGNEVGQGLEDLEGTLMDNVDGDARLSNGVQPGEGSDDLDFIQMTGLTSPGTTQIMTSQEANADLDPSVPVSFYERGVQDVDGAMEPNSMETSPSQSEEEIIVPVKPEDEATSDSVENLRSIISDLSSEDFETDREDHPVATSGDDSTTHDANEEPSDETGSAEPEPIIEAIDTQLEVPVAPISPPEKQLEAYQPEPMDAMASIAQDNVAAAASNEIHEDLPTVPVSNGLAEAESLLQELEGQQGKLVSEAPNVEETPGWAMPEGASSFEGGESDETVYNRAQTAGRRRGRRRKTIGRKLVRIAAWLIVLGAAAAGGVYTYHFYGEFMATEQETYNQAVWLQERGEFVEASMAFANFAAEHSNSPRTPQAEFAAANALSMVRDTPDGEAEQSYQQAIALFGAFIQNNPGHEKVARAEILTGILYARLGQHEQAVRTLYDPDRRLLDQVGYLNALRTLARSYAELGEVESTHAAFLRAASLSENPTPDRDFLELATFYKGWAERAEMADLRRNYQEAAIRQWNRALQLPGLVKARIDNIEAQRDSLLYTMKGEAASSALTDSQ